MRIEALELLLGSTPQSKQWKVQVYRDPGSAKNAIILVVTGILESWVGGRSKLLRILAKSLCFYHVKNPAGLKMTTTNNLNHHFQMVQLKGTIRPWCRRTSCGPQVRANSSNGTPLRIFFPKSFALEVERLFVEWFFPKDYCLVGFTINNSRDYSFNGLWLPWFGV